MPGSVTAAPGLGSRYEQQSATRLPNRGESRITVFAATATERKLLRALLSLLARIGAALAIAVAIHSPEPTMPWQRLVADALVSFGPLGR